jgi:putative addiction module killer protein
VTEVLSTDEFTQWLRKLKDVRARYAISTRIERLADGDAKAIGSGVSELRIHYGPGYRVYYTRLGGQIYILLCGCTKSSQSKDITKAIHLAQRVKEQL